MNAWIIEQIEQERAPKERTGLQIPMGGPEPAHDPEETLCTPRGVRVLEISPEAPNTIAI